MQDDSVFERPEFLEKHIASTLAFYDPRVFAKEGGFHGCFLDNGTCFDPDINRIFQHAIASISKLGSEIAFCTKGTITGIENKHH